MKNVLAKMALQMLREALLAAVNAERIDAVIDQLLEATAEAAEKLLAKWPELAQSVRSLVDSAKEGQAAAKAIESAIVAILDTLALPMATGGQPPQLDQVVGSTMSAELGALQAALYECDNCDDGNCGS